MADLSIARRRTIVLSSKSEIRGARRPAAVRADSAIEHRPRLRRVRSAVSHASASSSERASFSFCSRGEGIGIGMAARIRGPRQIAVDVRQARLAIARQVAQPVVRRRGRLAHQFLAARHQRQAFRPPPACAAAPSARSHLPSRSLPLARDKGTARNSPSSAGDSHASSGGERNHTIDGGHAAQEHVPLVIVPRIATRWCRRRRGAAVSSRSRVP